MTVYNWPGNLTPEMVGFDPRGMTLLGPLSLSGQSQAASSDTGYWIATLKGVWVMEPDKVQSYRALRALLMGGTNQVLVPTFDYAQIPYPLDIHGKAITSEPNATWDDGATFDDGSGWLTDPTFAVSVNAQAIGDTMMVINFEVGGTLQAGVLFSIGPRLYVIAGVLSVSSSQYTVQVWPRLRDAVGAGDEINFARPACKMRLTTDADSDLLLDMGRFAQQDMTFVEVLQ